MGLTEGPLLYDIALTRLRTFNGPALVERCRRTWKNQSTIYLEYRDATGMEANAPIMAVRAQDTDDGFVLLLWIRRDPEEAETELGLNDDDDFDGDVD